MTEQKQGEDSGKRRRRRKRGGSGNSGSGGNSGGGNSGGGGRSGGGNSGGGGRSGGGRSSGGKSGNSGRGRGRSGGGGNSGGGNGNNRRRGGRNNSIPKEKFGGREPTAESETQTGPFELSGFELFCRYFLGVTRSNGYRKPQMREVARMFDRSVDEIHDALRECGMDKESLKGVDFDMSLAQLDVRVAPEGVDKREIAKNLFEEFVELNPNYVEWSEPEEEEEEEYDNYEDDFEYEEVRREEEE